MLPVQAILPIFSQAYLAKKNKSI